MRARGPGAAGGSPGELRVASFTLLGDDWQAIDTPGSIELLQVAKDALLAADAAVICVGPDPAAALLASPYLHAVEAAGTPAVIFINRIDEAAERVSDIVTALQDYAERPIVLRQVPIRDGERVVGAVDLVSERAWSYREGEASTLIEIPSGMLDREHEARAAMLEHLSEFDDTLLEELIEDKEPPSAEVYSICKRVLSENRVMEALIGSGLHGNGIVRVMKALRHEAPRARGAAGAAAAAGRARRRARGGDLRQRLPQARGQDAAPARAAAAGRRHPARRAAGGAADAGRPARQPPSRRGARRGHRQRRQVRPPGGGQAGDAGGSRRRARLARAAAGDHAADPRADLRARRREALGLARLDRRGRRGPVVSQDPATGGALVGAQGPLHLRLVRQRLKDVFGMEVEEVVPSPAYRETITKPHETAYRHKKQTGGAGQFADVKLTVGPGDRGAGFGFTEVVKGGAVPRNYIPAVENGARDAMERGPLGFPVVDVAVTLVDGQHHPVDSSDMAFRIAGRQGTREALKAAGPVLLQPIYRIAIHAPAQFTGSLGPIVSSHLGQVLGFDADPAAKGWEIFEAIVPGSALGALANDVRASTQGVGWFDARFDHYDELHGKAAEKIVQERAKEPA